LTDKETIIAMLERAGFKSEKEEYGAGSGLDVPDPKDETAGASFEFDGDGKLVGISGWGD
jgi:hypothetical protein